MTDGSGAGPSSNLGNAIGGSNGQAIDGLGALIGTAADFSGAIAFGELIAGLIEGLTGADVDPLQVLQNTLNEVTEQLGAHQTSEDISTRLTNIGNALTYALPVLQGLTADVHANLSAAEVEERIEKCSGALDALGELIPEAYGGVWYAPYQDQIYWTDYPSYGIFFYGEHDPRVSPPPAGAHHYNYNAQVPGQDPVAPAGNVYSYVMALPAYLKALCIWLTVARALAPTTFVADYSESVITPAWQFLEAQHNKIVDEGFVELSPVRYTADPLGGYMPIDGPVGYVPAGNVYNVPNASLIYGGPVGTPDPIWSLPGGVTGPPTPVAWTGRMLRNWWTTYPLDAASLSGVTVAGVPAGSAFPQPEGGANVIFYGTVEVFSGFSAIGLYQLTYGTGEGLLDPNSSDLSAYHKFQVRLMATRISVYIDTGLLSLWKTINAVRRVVGQTELPRPSPADWSCRAISQIIGTTSLRAIEEFMTSTPPDDVPTVGPAGSLRAVLEVFTPAPPL